MTALNYDQVVLVHPLGYQADAAGHDISRLANIMPPLGLACIAAYLEKHATIQTTIVDYFSTPDSDSRLQEYLRHLKPGFLGISSTTSSFYDAVRVARLAKACLPGIRVVVGGPHVSALKEAVLDGFPDIDYTIVGEGEETFLELIQRQGQQPEDIKGLVFRQHGQAVFNGYRATLELDSLPFPAYEKLEGYPGRYKLPIFNYPTTPNSSCVSSRGCPYACSYCDRSVFRRTFRYNSAEYLYEHMRYLKQRFGIRHLNFYDDQFTFNRNRVEQLCSMLINHPLDMTFNCAVRAEHVDDELLGAMKNAGCWMASLGIETADITLLSRHRQNADVELLAHTIGLIKKNGIRTKGLLMIGLPGETQESVRKSMDFVFANPIDDFNLAKFTPFPGSPLYENIHALGTFEEDWEKMDCMQTVFVPEGMTREQLDKLFIRFYAAHYKRPKVLLGYVAMLWKSPDSWLRFIANSLAFLRFTRNNKRIQK
ncbi:MAG: B12-binding domain-containing radical SAM protein [Spartobacteria bacterium]|nr:B12-binding domain-containing radical SAM protein [Spartobacteria bacterium]